MSSAREDRVRRISGFISGHLIAEGLITLEQLDAALERQLSLAAQGETRRLGEVLVEIGAVSPQALERALARPSTDQDTRRTEH